MSSNLGSQDGERVDTYTLRSTDDNQGKECLLLFSGGLDTSCMLKYLQQKYGLQVSTLLCDIGQEEDFSAVQHKALALGAKEHITHPSQEEFVRNYLWPAVMLNATYRRGHPIASSLSRRLITKIAVQVAKEKGISVIAHGATGKGNDSFRFDNGILIESNGEMQIVAPVREWNMTRAEEIAYAKKHDIPVDATKKDSYSIDENMWGREIEAGGLDDLSFVLPERIYKWTSDIESAPNEAGEVTIEFKKGQPSALSISGAKGFSKNITGDAATLIHTLNQFAGQHAVGRHDHLEERAGGFKVREIHESPAATVLIEAHRRLESAILTPTELDLKQIMENSWTRLLVTGFIDPALNSIEAFAGEVNKRVGGEVTLKLLKGNIIFTGLKPEKGIDFQSLFNRKVIESYNQAAVPGAIEATGLGSRAAFFEK